MAEGVVPPEVREGQEAAEGREVRAAAAEGGHRPEGPEGEEEPRAAGLEAPIPSLQWVRP